MDFRIDRFRFNFKIALTALALLASLNQLAAAAPTNNPSELIDRNVPAPMRDGIVLRANVHRPLTGGPYPVLLMRTPYNKDKQHFDTYTKAGYIVACQDVRGRYASDGAWESWLRPRTHDAEDGYDSVQWAAKLPGANGKVGTIGLSYSAFLQWRLAALHPPALVAMSAHSIPTSYLDLEGPGTIRPGRRLRWWGVTMAPELRRHASRPGTQNETEAGVSWDAGEGEQLLNFLPWMNLPTSLYEDEAPFVRAWLANPRQDPWQLEKDCRKVAVPNLEVCGWYDHAKGDMLLQQTLMKSGASETARKGSKMVIGPWSHFPPGGRRFGNIDFGPAADISLPALDVRWFDYWLKNKANGLDREAPIRIFVMGDNIWRNEQVFPPKTAKSRIFFLGGKGKANTPDGNGTLAESVPVTDSPDHYDYDPRDPVRTLFAPGNFTCAMDQSPLAGRKDILVYQTEPLTQRVEATGFPEVELYADSSAPDTDWIARLIDVSPDGLARDVCMGVMRARYRNGPNRSSWIKPGKTYKYTIRLAPTSNAFLPGHRIRLDITSSDFPNYDRNHNTDTDPNTDAKLVTASQTVHHGLAWPSKLILPWVPETPAGEPKPRIAPDLFIGQAHQ